LLIPAHASVQHLHAKSPKTYGSLSVRKKLSTENQQCEKRPKPNSPQNRILKIPAEALADLDGISATAA